MRNNIATLIYRNLLSAFLCLLLCVMMRSITLVTFTSYSPSSIVSLYNMLVCHTKLLVKGKIT